MNIIFVTMSGFYQSYFDTYLELKKKLGNVGFYVSDKMYFEKNKNDDGSIQYLKEWEIVEQISKIRLNRKQIEKFEVDYFDDEALWHSINNDRRLFFGKYCKHTQDYKPSYSIEEMLKLFQVFVQNIEGFIKNINPNIIFGVTPATIGDYLFFRIARAQQIPYFTLKTVKIGNYQTFTQTIREEHSHINYVFNEYMNGKEIEPEIEEKSWKYLTKFEKGVTAYEGNVPIPKNNNVFQFIFFINFCKNLVKDILTLRKKRDNHSKALYCISYLYDYPIKNLRTKRLKKLTKSRTIYELEKIEKGNYIFFPLHAEPEIAISNYARFYQNQIETIRNIALQLPSKYELLIKEHPRNIGRRSLGYYEKILNIPNVTFADFELPSLEVVKRVKMIIVLSGNIGFEAVLSGIPLISLGNAMYNMLPETMVNYLDNIKELHVEIQKTIAMHKYSKEILKKYLSAIIQNSFQLDLYTVLLRKPGREGGNEFNSNIYRKNIKLLSIEILKLCKRTMS